MFIEAKKGAELFLWAHQGTLVQRGFFQHVNSVSSTARNSPSDACGGAGDGWCPQPYPHKVKWITVRALYAIRHLSTQKKHKGDDDQTRKEILSFRSSFFPGYEIKSDHLLNFFYHLLLNFYITFPMPVLLQIFHYCCPIFNLTLPRTWLIDVMHKSQGYSG